MLAIKGYPGRDYVSIGELAERLQLRHHSTVELVDRLVRRGLLKRLTSKTDRRRVEVRVTREGETFIRRLSAAHLKELKELSPELQRLLAKLGT